MGGFHGVGQSIYICNIFDEMISTRDIREEEE